MPHAEVNGLRICYETEGSPADPALVLVTGLGCQLVHWAPGFCRMIAERGYFVVRFDQRDVGESSKLGHLGTPHLLTFLARAPLGHLMTPPYTLRDMALDLLGLLDVLAVERAHVVGASMGGMVAQHLAILAPERVASLCLWMTSMQHRPMPPPHLRVLRRLVRQPTGDRARDVAQAVALFRSFSGGVVPFDDDLCGELAAQAWDRDHDGAGFLRHLAALLAEPSRAAPLSQLRIPTLVMHGQRDPMIPFEHAELTARTIPGARLHPLPELGHEYPMARWPELVEIIGAHAAGSAARPPT